MIGCYFLEPSTYILSFIKYFRIGIVIYIFTILKIEITQKIILYEFIKIKSIVILKTK
jgi:hypothetical protein